jgi:N-acyl-D-amino-acid deacylase
MCLRAATGKYAGQILDRDKYIEMRTLHPRDSLIYDPGDNTDVFVAYSLPDVMVSTDCTAYPTGQGHPQGAATYPYFLRLLAKEREQFSMLEAVNRCTLLPAKAAGLHTKGRIECGMDADLVVLDWEHLREHAAFPGMGDPGAPPSGIRHVFVNGQPAICNEKRREEINSGYCIKR